MTKLTFTYRKNHGEDGLGSVHLKSVGGGRKMGGGGMQIPYWIWGGASKFRIGFGGGSCKFRIRGKKP